MSLFARVFGRGRPAPDEVTSAVAAAVDGVSGAVAHDVAYNHLQYASGALSGTVDVPSAAVFDEVLRVVHRALVARLGIDAERVVIYLSGRTPDGTTVAPADLALPDRPTGRDLARRFT